MKGSASIILFGESMPKTIELTQPIKGQHGPIKSISLREPKYGDFIDLGMPSVWVALADGGFSQETPQILGQWIERLADCDPNFLSQLSLKDTLLLRVPSWIFLSRRPCRARRQP
jgi:hypothetical protein